MITAGMELAGLLSEVTELPKSVLKSIFDEYFSNLEDTYQKKIDSDLKRWVWKKVSEEKLALLKERHQQLFLEVIRETFNEQKIREILAFRKETGLWIAGCPYSPELQAILLRNSVYTSLIEKAKEITGGWLKAIAREVSLSIEVETLTEVEVLDVEMRSRSRRRATHPRSALETSRSGRRHRRAAEHRVLG